MTPSATDRTTSIEPEHSVRVAIIGAGPAGLMAAEQLAMAGVAVDVYDAMPSVGRKFLRAGIGGLNLTHNEDWEPFLSRYGDKADRVAPWLRTFGPMDLREWAHSLGIDTYVGSSGRVFPVGNKAAPLLRAWLQRLKDRGVVIHTRHQWQGWSDDHSLQFSTPKGGIRIMASRVIFALGGGSWSKLGSNGAWLPVFRDYGIACVDFRPSNCGFNVDWPRAIQERFSGSPLKTVQLTLKSVAGQVWRKRGDALISRQGIEGGLVYAASALIRDQIAAQGHCTLYWDLLPDRSLDGIRQALAKRRAKDSVTNTLRKKLGLVEGKLALLQALVTPEQMRDQDQLSALIKNLPQRLTTARPLDEAISTDGGVALSALAEDLSLHQHPHLYCTGEMLDWEAPTGGYLLTACFASGVVAGRACAASLT